MEAGTEREGEFGKESSVSLPEEPLRESAGLAHETALSLCDSRCRHYQAAWQYLRALGLIKKLGGQSRFFVEVLSSLAAEGESTRVLVAGAADYSMPAHVYHAYLTKGAELKLALVDRCQTPLTMSGWYAERIGQPIELVQSDLLSLDFSEEFDVVVTSSLLGNFDDAGRVELFGALNRCFRADGKLIFANQVKEVATERKLFDPAAVEALGSRARQKAAELSGRLGFDPEVVEGVAVEYARRRESHPLPSTNGLTAVLRDSGFEIDRFDRVEEAGNREFPTEGPSMDEARTDARIVAHRV